MNEGRTKKIEPWKEGPLKLDNPTLHARAAKFPAEVRESFVWLAIYLRQDCQRYCNVLAARMSELGFEYDARTWSLVIRGQWFLDHNGIERAEPLIPVATFLSAVAALKKSAAKVVKGPIPFVITSTAQKIIDAVDTARSKGWVNRFVVVIGETGNQKSSTYNHLVRTIPNGECIRIEALGGGLAPFLADLDRCFGGCSQSNIIQTRAHIRRSLEAPTGSGLAWVIIIDNAQRLLDSKRGGDQRLMNYLLKLQEDLDFAVVLSFTPGEYSALESGRIAAYMEQVEGRAGGEDCFIRLPQYAPDDDLVLIAREFGFAEAAANKKKLREISRRRGRIRTFFDVMQRAKAIAGTGPITIEHIEAVEERRVKEDK
jgi:hypothetical protein